ncbi:hypothetical protein DL98DRAFT_581704 [Cadophora sp. DSE1049]|nr:hypothetical protein DL98DRAFT_581704 [Cadophora sp. DSE1049]
MANSCLNASSYLQNQTKPVQAAKVPLPGMVVNRRSQNIFSTECEELDLTYEIMEGLCPICELHNEQFPGAVPLVGNRIREAFDIPEAQQTAARRKRGVQIRDAWNAYVASLGESTPEINIAIVEDGNYYLFHFHTATGPQSWAVLYKQLELNIIEEGRAK